MNCRPSCLRPLTAQRRTGSAPIGGQQARQQRPASGSLLFGKKKQEGGVWARSSPPRPTSALGFLLGLRKGATADIIAHGSFRCAYGTRLLRLDLVSGLSRGSSRCLALLPGIPWTPHRLASDAAVFRKPLGFHRAHTPSLPPNNDETRNNQTSIIRSMRSTASDKHSATFGSIA